MSAIPDCLICGACCASPFLGEGYIQVTSAEEVRLRGLGLPVLEVVSAPAEEDRVILLGTRFNRERVRVCVALTGSLGRQVSCTIYKQRPQLCREFEAGSPECLEARRAARISP